MVVSFVSPLNAFFATVFDVSFVDLIVMVLSFLHPLNALAPIFVTLLGSVMLVRELHPLNAFASISFTFFPIVTFLSLVAPLNAFLPMVLILLPIVTLVTVLLCHASNYISLLPQFCRRLNPTFHFLSLS